MKIAILINSLGIGGAEHVAVNLAEHFHNKNDEVLLVTSRRAQREYSLSADIPRRILEEESAFQIPGVRVAARVLQLSAIWRQERPDILLSFIGKMNIYAIISAALLPESIRPRVYASVRSDPVREYPGMEMSLAKLLFRRADGIIFQTRDQARAFGGRVMRRGAILPNALNEEFLQPPCEGMRDGRIVMVGRLDENKNHEMVIRALSDIIVARADMILEIYGDGLPGDDTPVRLMALVKELGIDGNIRFMGRRDDIRACIEKASIFVLASGYEGMPNALLEAMASGLAVISTDCPCGGPATVIDNGRNGLLIPVGDEAALKDALERLISDADYRESLGREASKIQKRLSPGNVCTLWEKFLLG